MTQCRQNNLPKNSARVHSFESFGTQDGPGIRYVIFLQGCIARCIYCHNPDTWDLNAGNIESAQEVYRRIERVLPFMRASGGGVTVSGGEPLLQMDFLIELFKQCKKKQIHTAVDTSGFCFKNTDSKKMAKLAGLTDLFIVDIKSADSALHKKITSGKKLGEALSFIKMLEAKNKKYWIRYVLIPGLNDSAGCIRQLKDLLAKLKYCQKVEILPYHTLGRYKWRCLGLKYVLKNTPAATQKDIKKAQALLFG